jgi:hypothetical protein
VIVFRCCAAAILVGLLVSWALSGSYRHGVVVDGWRRYAISGDAGGIELRYGTRTNVNLSTNPPSVTDVSFASAGTTVTWFGPAGLPPVTTVTRGKTVRRRPSWPVVTFNRSPWPQSGAIFMGGELPVPKQNAGGTVTISYLKFGEQTKVTVVPYWIPIAAAGGLLALSFAIRHRRPPGHCRRCGYDLRASPDRCPECGTPAPGKS